MERIFCTWQNDLYNPVDVKLIHITGSIAELIFCKSNVVLFVVDLLYHHLCQILKTISGGHLGGKG